MRKIPNGRHTKEFREEASRLVIEKGISTGEAANRLSLPKSTLEAWVRAAKTGKVGDVGSNRRLLTEVEVELARVKRELTVVKIERDSIKNHRASADSLSLTSPLCLNIVFPLSRAGRDFLSYHLRLPQVLEKLMCNLS